MSRLFSTTTHILSVLLMSTLWGRIRNGIVLKWHFSTALSFMRYLMTVFEEGFAYMHINFHQAPLIVMPNQTFQRSNDIYIPLYPFPRIIFQNVEYFNTK